MRSATSVMGRYKRAHLSAVRFEGMPARDRRCGPFPFEPTLTTRNPLTSRSFTSIVAVPKEATEKIVPWAQSEDPNSKKAPTCKSRRDRVDQRLETALQPMIPALARSIELITNLANPCSNEPR
jgi:hypothetical protein